MLRKDGAPAPGTLASPGWGTRAVEEGVAFDGKGRCEHLPYKGGPSPAL